MNFVEPLECPVPNPAVQGAEMFPGLIAGDILDLSASIMGADQGGVIIGDEFKEINKLSVNKSSN